MDPKVRTLVIGAAGAGGDSYWITTITADTGSIYGHDLAIDSAGGVYVSGRAQDNAQNTTLIKLNKDGSYGWFFGKRFTGENIGRSVAVDSSNNVYLASGASGSWWSIAKLNSTGTLQWHKYYLDSGAGSNNPLYSIAVGPDAIYLAGNTPTNTVFAKLNLSGTLQWQRTYDTSSTIANGNGIAVDASGSIYINGRDGGGDANMSLTQKLSSTPSLDWSRQYGLQVNTATNTRGVGLFLDSSSNVYVGANIETGLYTYQFNATVYKYNSSGAIQWQRRVTTPSNTGLATITGDSDGNSYAVGNNRIYKISSTGTLLWQRSFTGGSYLYIQGAAVDSDKNLYITGFLNVSSVDRAFVAKLPADGSKTGTYGQFTYGTSSETFDTPSYSEGVMAKTLTTPSFVGTGTNVSATNSFFTVSASTNTL